MSENQFELIPHEIENTLIYQRAENGYVNATAMCRAVGKQFSDYRRLGTTKAFLAELSTVRGIPPTDLVVVTQGGRAELQGSRVHPDVAIHLAQWCSPEFAVAVSRLMGAWFEGKIKPVAPAAIPALPWDYESAVEALLGEIKARKNAVSNASTLAMDTIP